MFALSLPLVVGGLGLGVDTGYHYYVSMKLQAAADQAAYARALVKRGGGSTSQVSAAALSSAVENGFQSAVGAITVHTPPTSGANISAQAVEVLLSEPAPRFFTSLLTTDEVTASARAVAVFQSASSACVLALSTSAAKAAWFSGNSTATFNGCSVMSNSSAADAIAQEGAAVLETDCLISVGGILVSDPSNLTLSDCPAFMQNAPAAGDPYASLPVPGVPAGVCKTVPGGAAPLQPGNYCSGISINNTKTLNPGLYYVDGDFNLNANANITGNGVTIYVTGKITMNGNATVNLKAQTSGTYAGILFFANGSGTTNKFNGTAASLMTGAIYAPNQAIEYLGNFSGLNGCVQVVGLTVKWSGNTSVSTDCTAYGMSNIDVMQLIRVVE